LEPLPLEPIGPVPASERITVIDCLRGAALFGIITANMRGYNAPLGAYEDATRLWTWMPDLVWQAVIDCLVSGKFITIFAALFGVGFAIQMDRAMARGEGIAFYQRRLTILLAFGLVHSFVFWWGDILVSYALCGFYLLFFRHSRQRSILVWAHALYWFIVVLYTGFYISTFFHPATIEPESNLREVIDIYARGTLRQIFVQRAKDWLQINSFIFFLTRIVGIFLFGLWIWRQGYLAQPDLHVAWWKRAQRYGLTLGLLGSLAIAVVTWIYNPHPMKPTLLMVSIVAAQSLVTAALSLGYAATVVLLWQEPKWQRRLLPFSYVGRMALTNYLMQTVIATTLFYSYGFGLYGRFGPLADFFIGLIIYALQVPLSRWWLSMHRYGPMEWLWRRLTYGPTSTSSVP
jgi:uncharacterized protein